VRLPSFLARMGPMVRVAFTLGSLVVFGVAAAWGVMYVLQYRYENFSGPDVRPAFVELEPINLPIIVNGRPIESRTYVLVVETGLGQDMAVHTNMLRLRDAYISQMMILQTRRAPEDLNNTEFLLADLRRVSDPIVGTGIVRRVMLRLMTRHANPNA
jgi:hypothetical protein